MNRVSDRDGLMWCPFDGTSSPAEIHYPEDSLNATIDQADSFFPLETIASVREIVIVCFNYLLIPSSPTVDNQQVIIYRASTGAEFTRFVVPTSFAGVRLGIRIPRGTGFGVATAGTNAASYGGQLGWKYADV